MEDNGITLGTISLAAIFSGLLVLFLNHLLANTRDKSKLRRDQGLTLAEAFRPELDALVQTNDDARTILTPDAYKRHESALRHFMPYLSWCDRLRLRVAWARLVYHPKDKDKSVPFYEQYADCGSLTKRRAVRPKVIERINRLLTLAQK